MSEFNLKDVTFRALTQSDYYYFFKSFPRHTVWGISVLYKGSIQGVVGFWAVNGKNVLFTDFVSLDSFPAKFKFRVSKEIFNMLNSFPRPLYTYTTTSDKLLQRLGFVFVKHIPPYGNEYILKHYG